MRFQNTVCNRILRRLTAGNFLSCLIFNLRRRIRAVRHDLRPVQQICAALCQLNHPGSSMSV